LIESKRLGSVIALMKDAEFDLVIEPGRAERQYWTDLWRYRELFFFLSWRDILVRYKQTVIGVAWSILRPFMTMLAFVMVFHKVAKLESGDTPYAILVFVALLPWQLFSNALSESSNSLIGNANLISKVYFPRMIVPVSSIVVALIDFIFSFVILLFIMAYYGYLPTYRIVFFPFFLLIAFVTAVGGGLLLSALNVKYRDFRFVVPFIVQFGLYVSPVGFSSEIVPEKWRLLYSLNPMVGVIEGFRWCFLKQDVPLYLPGLFLSIGLMLVLLFIGSRYFRSTEKTFADRI
jgi:lipopolysaccharide transport system permease protein